jgi:hypothetical protein
MKALEVLGGAALAVVLAFSLGVGLIFSLGSAGRYFRMKAM